MVQRKTAIQLLEEAAENVILTAEPGESIEDQAARLISEEVDLIDQLTPQWRMQEVQKIIRSKRAELAKREKPFEQYLLPGFERLPQRIVIADGRRRPLANATYRQLREYLATLHKHHRDDPRVHQVKALMDLVRSYAQTEPGITVKEVCRREAERG